MVATEPCAACGEETAAGTAFYFDRRAVERAPGETSYVCSSCVARAAKGRRHRGLTDAEIQQLIRNGSMAFIAASGGSH